MFIKQVEILGFRSYGNKIRFGPFNKGQNAVIGFNGSGKSNFYKSFEFLLLDDFVNLSSHQRKSILHSGFGHTSKEAYVEVVFDNTSKAIPIFGEEIILKRSISATKDEFFINRKRASKEDFHNLLNSCGLSTNGYYVVRQGSVNNLAIMRDEDRYNLICDIAGTELYDKKRDEAVQMITESQQKMERIDTNLSLIDKRVEQLSAEIEIYNEYDTLQTDKEAIDILLKIRSNDNILLTIKNDEEELKKCYDNTMINHKEICESKEYIRTLKSKLNDVDSRLSSQKEELQAIDINSLFEEYINIKSMYDVTYSKNELQRQKLEEHKKQLECINEEIRVDKQNLKKVETNINELKDEIYELNYCELDGRSLEELQEEMKVLQDEQMLNMVDQRLEREEEIEKAQGELKKLNEMSNNLAVCINNSEKDICQKFEERERILQTLKLEKESYDALKKRLDKLYNIFYMSIPLKIYRALKHIENIDNNSNIYGPLYSLFNCDPRYYQAVEAIAKGQLFLMVVKDTDTSIYILNNLKQNRIGNITIADLSQIKSSKIRSTIEGKYKTMDSFLNYKSYITNLIRYIFGKFYLCESLEEATKVSSKYKVSCVTINGEIVNSNMSLSGGSFTYNRLSSYHSIEILNNEIREKRNRLREVENTFNQLTDEINNMRNILAETQRKKGEINEKAKEAEDALRLCIKNYEEYQMIYSKYDAGRKDKERKKREIEKRIYLISNNNVDKQQVHEYHEKKELLEKETKQYDVIRKRLEIELIPKKMKLEEVCYSISIDYEGENNLKMQVNKSYNILNEKRTVKQSIQNSIFELETQKNEIQSEINEKKEEIKVSTEQNNNILNVINSIENRIKKLMDQVMDVKHSENVSKFENLPYEDLIKKSKEISKKLKDLPNINHKASILYKEFVDRKSELIKQRDELVDNEKSLNNIIANLDERKNEEIEKTFKSVQNHFVTIFSKLVENGSSSLVMKDRKVHVYVTFDGHCKPMPISQLSGGQKSLVALALIFSIQVSTKSSFYLLDEVDAALDPNHRISLAQLIKERSNEAQYILTTFKPELLQASKKVFRVNYECGETHVNDITVEEAERIILNGK